MNPHGKNRRDPVPLTEAQRKLAAEAWELPVVAAVTAKYAKRHPALDFDGAVAERICLQIRDFDPDLSSIKTWAAIHAEFACLDCLRLSGPLFFRRTTAPLRSRRIISLETTILDTGPNGFKTTALKLVDTLGVRDPDPAEPAARFREITRGLCWRDEHIIWAYFIAGRTMLEVGGYMGLSESRISQLIARAIAFLRARHEEEREREGRRREA